MLLLWRHRSCSIDWLIQRRDMQLCFVRRICLLSFEILMTENTFLEEFIVLYDVAGSWPTPNVSEQN